MAPFDESRCGKQHLRIRVQLATSLWAGPTYPFTCASLIAAAVSMEGSLALISPLASARRLGESKGLKILGDPFPNLPSGEQ
jgi:hypothetical protein